MKRFVIILAVALLTAAIPAMSRGPDKSGNGFQGTKVTKHVDSISYSQFTIDGKKVEIEFSNDFVEAARSGALYSGNAPALNEVTIKIGEEKRTLS